LIKKKQEIMKIQGQNSESYDNPTGSLDPDEQESIGKASEETLIIVAALKIANANFSSSKNFEKYKKELRTIFGLVETNPDEKAKQFFAGFLEGEASMNVSAKKAAGAAFGVTLDPEFNVTQHLNGIKHLYLGLEIFHTGRISFKDGSSAVFVLKIDNRQSLEEKVIPFYNTYVAPYTSSTKLQRLKTLKEILDQFNKKVHLNLDSFVDDMLPLWDSIRIQRGQKNQTFVSLQEAQDYVRNESNHKVYKRVLGHQGKR
jgi:uncharacterized glyoxalase superfamily protein PhnB